MARLEQNLSHIAAKCPEAAGAALLKTGADIVNLVKQLTPVDTGALKQSYGVDVIDSNTLHIGSDMEYAPFVEFGTSKMIDQPHLVPAMLQSQKTMIVNIVAEMKRINGVS